MTSKNMSMIKKFLHNLFHQDMHLSVSSTKTCGRNERFSCGVSNCPWSCTLCRTRCTRRRPSECDCSRYGFECCTSCRTLCRTGGTSSPAPRPSTCTAISRRPDLKTNRIQIKTTQLVSTRGRRHSTLLGRVYVTF